MQEHANGAAYPQRDAGSGQVRSTGQVHVHGRPGEPATFSAVRDYPYRPVTQKAAAPGNSAGLARLATSSRPPKGSQHRELTARRVRSAGREGSAWLL